MALPTQFGNYKLERELGRGASSEVWLARHAHLQEHQVAVKILMTQDRDAIQRFEREAAIAARLRHPNVVQLYDYGYQAPFFYTVLELVPGGSLRQLLERHRRLQLAAAIEIFRQIAAALDYAHSLSIVHRDVSPANILVEQRTGRALLTDFGIARDPGRPITIASTFMGTPGYLSPEHAQSATAVTHLSDLFSLGIVLYQMLTGQMPWSETPGMPDGPAFTQPIPLKQHGVEGLPSDVDRVLATMLSLDPTRRFPSARAAVEELDRIFARHHMPTQVVVGAPGRPAALPAPVQLLAGGVESNAVEAVLGPDLARAAIDRAHRRAEDLRNPENVAALLNAWAAQGRLRRKLLGRLARLHKVSSRNVYFYRLRLLYEQRSPVEPDEEPDRKAEVFPIAAEVEPWSVKLPPVKDFVDDPGDRVALPGSTRVVTCPPCAGRGVVVCPRCGGRQRVVVTRPVSQATPSTPAASPGVGAVAASLSAPGTPARTSAPSRGAPAAAEPPPIEQVLVACPECNGRGGVTCERCEGFGRLIQRKMFRWQRSADLLRTHDNLPDLDEAWLSRVCKSEVIYTARQPGGTRPEWALIPGLTELVSEAQARLDANTRIVLSELTVSFIPVTDVVFDLGKPGDSGLYKLSIYGFENIIPADWRFLHWERVIFICTIVFLTIVTAITLTFALL